MARTGVTTTTFDSIMIGPGAIYKDFVSVLLPGTLIGATLGGSKIKIAREYYSPQIDGVLGPIKGAKRLVSEIPSIETKIIEITKENFLLALPGTASTIDAIKHNKITSLGKIIEADYKNIAIIADIAGKADPIVFVVKNAISTEPLEIATGTGKDDIALSMTFEGNYDPEAPTIAPYEIYVPLA
jgi:hypothetical protein